MDDIQVNTSDIRMACTGDTQLHTNTYERHAHDIEVHTSNI